jgi:hypothetical protein
VEIKMDAMFTGSGTWRDTQQLALEIEKNGK